MTRLAYHSALLIVFLTCGRLLATEPPRYRFELGQELHYTGTRKHSYEKEPAEVAWRLWVTQANADGSRELVIEVDLDRDKSQKCLLRAAVFPDGRMAWNPTMKLLPSYESLRRILPRLPTAGELAQGKWTEIEPRTRVQRDYSSEPTNGVLSLSAECRGPIELVAVGSTQFQWQFDPVRGVITSENYTGKWEDYHETDEESLSLTEVLQHDDAWTAKFRQDAQRYFEAVADRRSQAAPPDEAVWVRSVANVGLEELQKQVRTTIETAQAACSEPIVLTHFDNLLKMHDRSLEWRKNYLEEYQGIVDKKSPQWAASDLEGKTHSPADYLGKVLVLDMWFRKCSYCIRAQPQVDAVVERFKGRAVQFLGVNIDKDPEDARFAVARLQTPYPTLLGEDVKAKYEAGGVPCWFVIDQKGIVRSIHSGYSADLEAELTESISNLLK